MMPQLSRTSKWRDILLWISILLLILTSIGGVVSFILVYEMEFAKASAAVHRGSAPEASPRPSALKVESFHEQH